MGPVNDDVGWGVIDEDGPPTSSTSPSVVNVGSVDKEDVGNGVGFGSGSVCGSLTVTVCGCKAVALGSDLAFRAVVSFGVTKGVTPTVSGVGVIEIPCAAARRRVKGAVGWGDWILV